MIGKVKWFNNAKGYGFVLADGSDEDLFAHFSTVHMEGYKTLKAGQSVSFEIVQGPKGLHAINICPLGLNSLQTHRQDSYKNIPSEVDRQPEIAF